MKRKFFFLIIILLSCNYLDLTKNPYLFLVKYSGLEFEQNEIKVIKFNAYTSGLKEEGFVEGIYKINVKNTESLKTQMLQRQYKNFPLDTQINLGDDFKNYYRVSDTAFYKTEFSNDGLLTEIAIINLTQKVALISKVVNE